MNTRKFFRSSTSPFVIAAVAAIVLVAPVGAQGTVDGVWINSYGSLMRIQTGMDLVTGCYSSTTGSSGAYYVVGSYDWAPLPPSTGGPPNQQAIAVAIPWRSYLSGTGDTSWHWTSTMAGMYYKDAGGTEYLELINALNSTTIFTGLNPETGLYPETLTFTRYSDQSWQCPTPASYPLPVNSPIQGTWAGTDFALDLWVTTAGRIYGTATDGTDTFYVDGYYDFDTATDPPLPSEISVSFVISTLTLAGGDTHSAIAMTGNYDPTTGSMKMYVFKTFGATTYTSAVLRDTTFYKGTSIPPR